MNTNTLRQNVLSCLLELATPDGILASDRREIYGGIFGRDSAITILKILKASSNAKAFTPDEQKNLHEICKRSLLTLVSLQGKAVNLESGEEPGKFIHEYRRDNFDHLIFMEKPWYVYPDGILRNYDSLDATPLALIAIYRYFRKTKDYPFVMEVLPAVERGLNWIMNYGDRDGDYLVEYEFPETRQHGGVIIQSWADNRNTLLQIDGTFPEFPIAPVEVQGYVWLALRLWAGFFKSPSSNFLQNISYAKQLADFAMRLKQRFNETFLFKSQGRFFAAQALDGEKKQIRTITGNPLLLLWASYKVEGKPIESILDEHVISDIVSRAFLSDLFDEDCGIRTMSTLSHSFDPTQHSYHNGSFWPKLNGMAHEGLTRWGYAKQAKLLKDATLKPILYFGSPVELYIKGENGTLLEYRSSYGQVGCKKQAWSAAVVLDLVTASQEIYESSFFGLDIEEKT